MSEAQLREIPYKVVETNAKAMRVKLSPSSKQSHRSPRRNKRYDGFIFHSEDRT
jgi:hypothetical protein